MGLGFESLRNHQRSPAREGTPRTTSAGYFCGTTRRKLASVSGVPRKYREYASAYRGVPSCKECRDPARDVAAPAGKSLQTDSFKVVILTAFNNNIAFFSPVKQKSKAEVCLADTCGGCSCFAGLNFRPSKAMTGPRGCCERGPCFAEIIYECLQYQIFFSSGQRTGQAVTSRHRTAAREELISLS